jgi:hypothetical protein
LVHYKLIIEKLKQGKEYKVYSEKEILQPNMVFKIFLRIRKLKLLDINSIYCILFLEYFSSFVQLMLGWLTELLFRDKNIFL